MSALCHRRARDGVDQLQFFPATLLSSPTQIPSQLVLQQNGSAPQIALTVACVSQPEVSWAPASQSACAQLPVLQATLPATLKTSPMQTSSQSVLQQYGSAWQTLA